MIREPKFQTEIPFDTTPNVIKKLNIPGRYVPRADALIMSGIL